MPAGSEGLGSGEAPRGLEGKLCPRDLVTPESFPGFAPLSICFTCSSLFSAVQYSAGACSCLHTEGDRRETRGVHQSTSTGSVCPLCPLGEPNASHPPAANTSTRGHSTRGSCAVTALASSCLKAQVFPSFGMTQGDGGQGLGGEGGGLRVAAGTSAGSRAAPSRGKRSLRTRPAEPRKNPREGCLDFLLAFVSLQTWGSDTAEVTPRPTCVLPTIASYDVFCLQLMKNV